MPGQSEINYFIYCLMHDMNHFYSYLSFTSLDILRISNVVVENAEISSNGYSIGGRHSYIWSKIDLSISSPSVFWSLNWNNLSCFPVA